jgi:hypothetical protein
MYAQGKPRYRILTILTNFSILFLFSVLIAPTNGAQTVLHNTDAMSLDPNQPEVTLNGKRKQVFEDVLEVCESL